MAQRPNIVFFLNDHQAYHGHEREGRVGPQRPNFHRLAAEGLSFNRAVCATPLCGPDRRTLLTGLFAHNHRNYFNYTDAPFTEEVYLDRLAEAGYRNYYFGKWHAGPGTALDHGCEGFCTPAYGNPYITETYRRYLAGRGLPPTEHWIDGILWSDDFLSQFPNLKAGISYRCDSFWCGENAYGVTTTPKETHESFFLAGLACDQLEALAREGDDRPFSLRVDFWGPHQPHFPTQEFLDLYDPAQIAEYPSFRDTLEGRPEFYRRVLSPLSDENGRLISPNPWPWSEWQRIIHRCYAHISMLDAAGGMILDKLQALGLAENTLVIWTTDHGDALASHGGQWDKGSFMTEEVMRVPLAMRYPGVIPAGQQSDALVSAIDLAPTILDAAGLAFRERVDGESLLPLVTGERAEWRYDLMAETHGHGWGRYVNGRLIYVDNFKYIDNAGQGDELYDLAADPYELHNLAEAPNRRELVALLGGRLARWRETTRDPGEVIGDLIA